MKFSKGFDGLARENQFLRTISKILLLTTTALLGIVYSLYDRPPIIVERSSHGLEIVKVTDFARSPSDLKIAAALMLKARFNSDTISPEVFINPKQLLLRETEQKEMRARSMKQSLVVQSVTFLTDQAWADIDRVISVGEVRTALRARIRFAFEETTPTELNPYGLLLSLSEPIESKGQK